MDINSGIAFVTASGTLAAAFLIHRATIRMKLPQVLAFLITGLCARQIIKSPATVNNFTRYITDASLAAIGLQIGSHLNADTLGPIRVPILKFIIAFVPIVVLCVSTVAGSIFPSIASYAPLVGSIALERSSPEALAGILEARAQGPFSTSVMCIAAIQDVAALVAFVIFSALLGSGNAATTLGLVFTITGLVISVTYAGLLLLQRAVSSGSGGTTSNPTQSAVLVGVAAATVAALTVAHHMFESELLISAVVLGVLLNYEIQHPITKVLDGFQLPINIVLFTFLGMRINVVNYARELGPIVALAIARVFGLWLGSFAGATAAGFQTQRHTRWMGLVTQLAIALSLVTRMEEAFPQAAAMAQAYGGVAVLSLLTGPGLLQFVLQRSGEAGAMLVVGTSSGGVAGSAGIAADGAGMSVIAVGGSAVTRDKRLAGSSDDDD